LNGSERSEAVCRRNQPGQAAEPSAEQPQICGEVLPPVARVEADEDGILLGAVEADHLTDVPIGGSDAVGNGHFRRRNGNG
jgi:hypothetical protein